ncbi:excalibur calcium-binding domain-containing protein [Mycolicibacterium vanbaalenii]|nr:excalibur calcium-binding domain-containing protein [Mycolicibacterium vanbaalenii PYR-1]QZT59904.1 excalibur calcium-binding domain-containing protein [Mycolicibacterium austroafricanum]QZY49012.1 excalibur calcium-binding domain-containing protein [Mycolicibacterium austroafricanum]UJL31896.1 excalibur calcium-binding domain-containing protein [Mycolicibacterium vanbaalenii]
MGVGVSPVALANAAPYENCTDARANGDANIPSSSDRYGSHLDRDGDGMGCES